MDQCEELIIMSYTSQQFDKCDDETRERWLNEFTYRYADSSKVTVEVISQVHVPDDEAGDEVHREFCAKYLLNVMNTTVQAVFSSEDYGPGFAEYLTRYFESQFTGAKCPVDHISVDVSRAMVPTSGTAIRAMGPVAAYSTGLISEFVFNSLIPKVLILGGESSGKTTLAAALAKELNEPWVPEYGRELYEIRNGKLFYEDLEAIAIRQLEMEREASNEAVNLVICDTSPLTTLFYSKEMFGTASTELRLMAWRSIGAYDAVYLCDSNIPFDQDGTRRDPAFRDKAVEYYKQMYSNINTNTEMVQVHGSVEERVKMVIDDLKKRGML